MRLFALSIALTALAFAAAPASAQIKSDNVEFLGKVPDSAGTTGARFSPDGRTMYVTSASGLQIYDVGLPGTRSSSRRWRCRTSRTRMSTSAATR
jgi:hypothetical protein